MAYRANPADSALSRHRPGPAAAPHASLAAAPLLRGLFDAVHDGAQTGAQRDIDRFVGAARQIHRQP